MTPLESKIILLLKECEELLEPTEFIKKKRIRMKGKNSNVISLIDPKTSLDISFARVVKKIEKLSSYKDILSDLKSDNLLKQATAVDQYWTSPNGIIHYLISHAGTIKKNKVYIDTSKAITLFQNFRNILKNKSLNLIATARLLGVTFTQKYYHFLDGIVIRCLTKKEINDRQPTYNQNMFPPFEDFFITEHSVEICLPLKVNINLNQQESLFFAKINAKSLAYQKFNRLVDSILIVKDGIVKLNTITLHGDAAQIQTDIELKSINYTPSLNIKLTKKDLPMIESAYNLLSDVESIDKTLNRSLHRFLLGRKRADSTDKLIDYIIAWEALLLTNKGNLNTQELSYRFSLNGATLISFINKRIKPKEVFQKMKCAYSVRSSIVHGGTDEEINKKMVSGGFDNIKNLCLDLEKFYRNTVLGLHSMKPEKRPYIKKDGWEDLIFRNYK